MLPRVLLLFACLTSLAIAQQHTARRIDEIFEKWNYPDSPGAVVAVIRDGKVAFQRGYGIANLEYDIPIKPDTVFHVASVSKQFTAMSLVLLEQDGKLSIDDDVHKYLPELPDYGHKITIRNLLQHTAGIRDQWQTLGIAGWHRDDVITQKQILRMLFRQRELNFDPGTRHLDSNGDFTLAAEIVARVSGKPLPEFCEERIFKPLRMTCTHFHIDHQRIVRNRAYSYLYETGGYRALPLNYANVGATGLFTTAPDLARWLDNFRDPEVGGPKAIARLQEQAVLTSGEKVPYALGIAIAHGTFKDAGGDAGYRSYVAWYPEERFGVAVLSNLANFNAPDVAYRVASVYLKHYVTTMPRWRRWPLPPRLAPFEPGDVEQYLGAWWSDELETQYTILRKDGKLVADHAHHGEIALTPVGKDQLRTTTWFMPEVKFLRDPAGNVTAMTLGGNRLTGIRFVRRIQ